jgi:hypothetical protein
MIKGLFREEAREHAVNPSWHGSAAGDTKKDNEGAKAKATMLSKDECLLVSGSVAISPEGSSRRGCAPSSSFTVPKNVAWLSGVLLPYGEYPSHSTSQA